MSCNIYYYGYKGTAQGFEYDYFDDHCSCIGTLNVPDSLANSAALIRYKNKEYHSDFCYDTFITEGTTRRIFCNGLEWYRIIAEKANYCTLTSMYSEISDAGKAFNITVVYSRDSSFDYFCRSGQIAKISKNRDCPPDELKGYESLYEVHIDSSLNEIEIMAVLLYPALNIGLISYR